MRRSIECVVIVAAAGLLSELDRARGYGGPEKTVWDTSYRAYMGAPTVAVAAVTRDFASSGEPNAHPDFGISAPGGAGRYVNITADELGPDGKPIFRSTGQRVLSDWTDAQGNVMPPRRPYIGAAPGDVSGLVEEGEGGAVTSAATFAQWFRDVPGVNTTSRSALTFARNGTGTYTFEGSLDGVTGSDDYDYTTEVEYHFVYEEGKDWYFEADTDAEVWVFIDGKLVIDGGGSGGAVDFDITDGEVVPTEPYSASITVLGAAMSYNTLTFPVTLSARVGGAVSDPFGPSHLALAGNLNDDGNPRHEVLATDAPAGTGISVIATSWEPLSMQSPNYNNEGSWRRHMTVDSATGSHQVKVLRDGDTAPEIRPFQDQATILSFLRPYIDPDTQRVTLAENQAIYLFELWTTDLRDETADFQDIAVLVTLSRPGSESGVEGGGTGGVGAAAPRMTQRIDLDRLGWLEDRGSHRMKILFANRTGGPSNLALRTNILTLNLANRPVPPGRD